MPAPAMIELQNVSRTYGEHDNVVHAVRDVSVEVARGSFAAIVGASGSGKSTLLNLIGALDTPSSGTVRVDGSDLGQLSDDERTKFRRDKIGFVFQFFNLLPTLSALENVTLPPLLAGRGGKETEARAEALLDQVGLSQRLQHLPNQLSGGEMQRVAIARALIMDAPLLVADEPTGNLDSKTGRSILQLLRGTADGERTVVLVTHDPKIAGHADRVITMRDGTIVDDRSPNASTDDSADRD